MCGWLCVVFVRAGWVNSVRVRVGSGDWIPTGSRCGAGGPRSRGSVTADRVPAVSRSRWFHWVKS
eukprot:3721045-Prymnesium_polylepis.1